MVWLRRTSQILFLGLFVILFLNAGFHPGTVSTQETAGIDAQSAAFPAPEDRPGTGVRFFFNIDPLILVTTWLAGHTILTAMLLALVTIVLTALFGRFFCGWFCPLGTLHNATGTLRGGKFNDRVHRGVWSKWQRSKYLVLVVVIVCALVGVQLAGILDPASFLYRATVTVIYPAFSRGTASFFNFLYRTDPGVGPLRVTAVSEPVYSWLRNNVLPTYEIYFTGGLLIGGLCFLALGLNLARNRFWCRYVCPLGALLGVLSRFTIFRVKNDESVCKKCNQCVECCPSGADPHHPDGWHRSECFMCWNCKRRCPVNAIRIGFEAPSLRVAAEAPTGHYVRAGRATTSESNASAESTPRGRSGGDKRGGEEEAS